MSLLSSFTGGKSKEAIDALKRAESYFGSINTPTIAQLSLPELQKYVEAGIMTPEEAQSYLQESNAYNDQNIDQSGTSAQMSALSQLGEIANAGSKGTPAMQAALDNIQNRLNTSVGGQRGAIEQEMAARGTPQSLIQAALSNQSLGQDAQLAHEDSMNAYGQNYQAALNALSQQGGLGGQLQGQQNAQANQVSAAQNAMQQFNAQNQQQNSQFNAANRQDANTMNAANRQQIANNNTGLANSRTQYNANLPQQVFENQMNRASGQAGAATNIASMQQKQGQQNAGINSGLINLATSFIPKPAPTPGAQNQNQQPQQFAHGGIVGDQNPMYCNDGAMIPGEANFPGDSMANDTVPVMASPGEAIIPRSSVAENPDIVGNLLDGSNPEIVDPQDVATLLKALRAIRTGA